MPREYSKVRFTGQFDHGPRTCKWSADVRLQREGPEGEARLLEVEDTRLTIEVFSEDLSVKLGEYSGAEVPDAESLYWETYINGVIEARVARGSSETDYAVWAEEV